MRYTHVAVRLIRVRRRTFQAVNGRATWCSASSAFSKAGPWTTTNRIPNWAGERQKLLETLLAMGAAAERQMTTARDDGAEREAADLELFVEMANRQHAKHERDHDALAASGGGPLLSALIELAGVLTASVQGELEQVSSADEAKSPSPKFQATHPVSCTHSHTHNPVPCRSHTRRASRVFG